MNQEQKSFFKTGSVIKNIDVLRQIAEKYGEVVYNLSDALKIFGW